MNKAPKPILISRFPDMGREIWAKWDEDSCCYELFASQACDDFIGSADTLADCRRVAKIIADDWMSY